MHRLRRFLSIAGVLAVLSLGLSHESAAQQRVVIVNGLVLSPDQLYVLDQMAGGFVPNGNYWLDPNTGIWGYAGNPTPMGQLGGGGGSSGINTWGADGPGYNRRTPGGDLMSDGNCAFVAGVPVGNC